MNENGFPAESMKAVLPLVEGGLSQPFLSKDGPEIPNQPMPASSSNPVYAASAAPNPTVEAKVSLNSSPLADSQASGLSPHLKFVKAQSLIQGLFQIFTKFEKAETGGALSLLKATHLPPEHYAANLLNPVVHGAEFHKAFGELLSDALRVHHRTGTHSSSDHLASPDAAMHVSSDLSAMPLAGHSENPASMGMHHLVHPHAVHHSYTEPSGILNGFFAFLFGPRERLSEIEEEKRRRRLSRAVDPIIPVQGKRKESRRFPYAPFFAGCALFLVAMGIAFLIFPDTRVDGFVMSLCGIFGLSGILALNLLTR